MKMQKIVILCAVLTVLAGCGQRGNLHFPEDPVTNKKLIAAQTPEQDAAAAQ
ncbi:MAG: LPS translocon maturation chaperone LptM [Vibrionaceae bacterium]